MLKKEKNLIVKKKKFLASLRILNMNSSKVFDFRILFVYNLKMNEYLIYIIKLFTVNLVLYKVCILNF